MIRQRGREKIEQSIPPQGYSTGKQRMQDDEISIYPQAQQEELRKLCARNPEILFITLEEANFGVDRPFHKAEIILSSSHKMAAIRPGLRLPLLVKLTRLKIPGLSHPPF